MEESALMFVETALSALQRALHERGSELRNVQLATLSPDGAPGLRTVVLRGFERAPAGLEMHTDARAAKVRDLGGDNRVSVLAWSAEAQLQLRFDGTARLHRDDAVARGRWDALSPNGRNAYGLRSDPGRRIEDPENRTHLPEDEQFRCFTVMMVSPTSVDVLRLGPDGAQTRAIGRFDGDGLSAEWVGP